MTDFAVWAAWLFRHCRKGKSRMESGVEGASLRIIRFRRNRDLIIDWLQTQRHRAGRRINTWGICNIALDPRLTSWNTPNAVIPQGRSSNQNIEAYCKLRLGWSQCVETVVFYSIQCWSASGCFSKYLFYMRRTKNSTRPNPLDHLARYLQLWRNSCAR